MSCWSRAAPQKNEIVAPWWADATLLTGSECPAGDVPCRPAVEIFRRRPFFVSPTNIPHSQNQAGYRLVRQRPPHIPAAKSLKENAVTQGRGREGSI